MQSFAEAACARESSEAASSRPEAIDSPPVKPRRNVAFVQERTSIRGVRAREIEEGQKTFEKKLIASLAAAAN